MAARKTKPKERLNGDDFLVAEVARQVDAAMPHVMLALAGVTERAVAQVGASLMVIALRAAHHSGCGRPECPDCGPQYDGDWAREARAMLAEAITATKRAELLLGPAQGSA